MLISAARAADPSSRPVGSNPYQEYQVVRVSFSEEEAAHVTVSGRTPIAALAAARAPPSLFPSAPSLALPARPRAGGGGAPRPGAPLY